jgi:hypothetical protein
MRSGTCISVLDGDTILLDKGGTRLRYCNVWAPGLGTPLGDALKAYNEELVLGKAVAYMPNGHVHWDSLGLIADVYVGNVWVNQELRFWLSQRMKAPVWREGIPGGDNPNTEV